MTIRLTWLPAGLLCLALMPAGAASAQAGGTAASSQPCDDAQARLQTTQPWHPSAEADAEDTPEASSLTRKLMEHLWESSIAPVDPAQAEAEPAWLREAQEAAKAMVESGAGTPGQGLRAEVEPAWSPSARSEPGVQPAADTQPATRPAATQPATQPSAAATQPADRSPAATRPAGAGPATRPSAPALDESRRAGIAGPAAGDGASSRPAYMGGPVRFSRKAPAEAQALIDAAGNAPKGIPEEVLRRLRGMPASDLAEPLKVADGLFASGQHEAALVFYELALKKTTDEQARAWVLFQMGNCQKDSDPGGARRAYRQMMQEFPASPWTPVATMLDQMIQWHQVNQPYAVLRELESPK